MIPAPQIGHNMPPSDEEILNDKLKNTYAKQILTVEELSVRVLPDVVDDETSAAVTDYLAEVKAAKKAIDLAHSTEKSVFLVLGKIVDGFKNRNITKLEKAAQGPKASQESYLLKKAQEAREAERRKAEEDRRKAAELAEQAEAHAAEGIEETAAELAELAIVTDEKALRKAEYAATAKASALAKTTTESGNTSGLRTVWVGEPENGSYSGVDLAALRRFIKDEHIQMAINAFVRDGGRSLGGVTIYQKSTLR